MNRRWASRAHRVGSQAARLCWGLSLLVPLTLNGAACSTVQLEDPPSDVNSCRPSQMFFVNRVWPEFLAQNYNGRTCGDTTCHGSPSGPEPRVIMPTSVPTFPFLGGSDWEKSYRSVTQRMTCTNVRASELYTRPAGLATHGGGKLIEPDGPEALLLEMWVTASP